MDIREVLARLQNVVENRSKDNQWTARCPAHEDDRNSLGIAVKQGRVLLHCYAGCRYRDIAFALRIRPEKMTQVHCPKQAPRRVRKFLHQDLAAKSLGLPVAAEWHYRNADGSTAFYVYRFERSGKGKEIRPVRQVEDGFVFGMPDGPRPMYRLPEINAHEGLVVVAEGEKAADAIIEDGWCATTSAGGAAAAHRTDWSPLAMRRVLVWPDNDQAGSLYADKVADILRELGADVMIRQPVGGRGDDAADCPSAELVLIGI